MPRITLTETHLELLQGLPAEVHEQLREIAIGWTYLPHPTLRREYPWVLGGFWLPDAHGPHLWLPCSPLAILRLAYSYTDDPADYQYTIEDDGDDGRPWLRIDPYGPNGVFFHGNSKQDVYEQALRILSNVCAVFRVGKGTT